MKGLVKFLFQSWKKLISNKDYNEEFDEYNEIFDREDVLLFRKVIKFIFLFVAIVVLFAFGLSFLINLDTGNQYVNIIKGIFCAILFIIFCISLIMSIIYCALK